MSLSPLQECPFKKPLGRVMWWLLFLIATYITSLGFSSFGAFTHQPTLQNALIWLLVMVLLFQSILLLVYDSYVQEKIRGKVEKPVRLFEWMIRKRFLLRISSAKKGSIQ